MPERRSKYYEQQVIALKEAQEPATRRDMVLNLSVCINEAQTMEMIGAKRDFYLKFIEQEVIALRYQVAQERNYETKSPKKAIGGEKSFAQKENYEKEEGISKPYSGRENQSKKE